MKIIFSVLLIAFSSLTYGQATTLPLRADTVVIEKTGSSAELKIKNSTRDSLGLLVNIGGGRTRFMRVRQITDTSFIIPNGAGGDTIRIAAGEGGGSGAVALPGQELAFGTTSGISSSSNAKYDTTYDAVQVGKTLARNYIRAGDTSYRFAPSLRSYFFGNSITAGSSITPTYYRWPTRVANGTNTIEVNYGIGGTRMVSLATGDSAMQERTFLIPTYSATRDGYLFFAYGTNDAVTGTIDTATFRSVYYGVIDNATGKGWPTSRIILVSVGYYLHSNSGLTARGPIFRDVIRSIALNRGVNFVDARQAQENVGAMSTLRLPADSVHWNEMGNQAVALAALDTLGMKSGDVRANGDLAGRSLRIRGWANGGSNNAYQAATVPALITIIDSLERLVWELRATTGVNPGEESFGIGTDALKNLTTGVSNMAVGPLALPAVTTGSNNAAVGGAALNGLTTGGSNTAIGKNAMFSNQTASDLTAIGRDAMYSNTSGIQNTAVGTRALRTNSTGNNNTALGYYALEATTGGGNTGIGQSALRVNGSGIANTAVGTNALLSAITAANNTAVGNRSLRAATGGNNTAVGGNALDSATTGTDNTAIGYRAGYNLKTGAGNVLIGDQAGLTISSGSNNIMIGRGWVAGDQSALLWLSPGQNDYRVYSIADGKTGLGTNAPTQRLHVAGKVAIDTVANGDSDDSVLVIANKELKKIAQSSLGGGGGSIARNALGDSLVVGTSAVLDRDNAYINSFYQAANLRNAEPRYYKATKGYRNYNILIQGSSQVEFSWIYDLNFKTELSKKIDFSGPGLVSGNLGRFGLSNTIFADSNWTLLDGFGDGGKGLDAYSIQSTNTSTGFKFFPAISNVYGYSTFDSLQVMFMGKTGGGTFEVYSDGVLKATLNTSSWTGFKDTTFYLGSESGHTIYVRQSAFNSAGCEILGFNCKRAVIGARVHIAGQSGLSTGELVALDSALYIAQLRALRIDMMVVDVLTNDKRYSIHPDTSKARLKRFIRWAKVADPNISIIIIAAPGYNTGPWGGVTTYTTQQYCDKVRQIALEDTVADFDLNTLFGPYNTAIYNERGILYDGLHYDTLAGKMIVQGILSALPSQSVQDDVPKVLFKDLTAMNRYVGININPPAYRLDMRDYTNSTNSQNLIHTSAGTEDVGGWMGSVGGNANSNNLFLMAGSTFNSTNSFLAKAGAPSVLALQNATLNFQNHHTQTPGSTYTPRSLFYVGSNGAVGLRTATPEYPLRIDVRDSITTTGAGTLLGLRTGSSGENGLYMGAAGGTNGTFGFTAVGWWYEPVAFAFRAKAANAVGTVYNAGNIDFYGNTSLTPGNTFTPTVRARIQASNGRLLLGTTTDNTIGLLQVNGKITSTADSVGTPTGGILFKDFLTGEYKITGFPAAGMSNPMTTAADLIVGGVSGAATRFAAGTANQVLGMNNGATAQEYKTLTAGNNFSITHGTGSIVAGVTIPNTASTVDTVLVLNNGIAERASITALLTALGIDADDYVPALTAITNVDDVDLIAAHYMRFKDIINADIMVSIDVTADASATSIDIDLPFAAAISDNTNLTGIITNGSGTAGNVVAAGGKARVTFTSTGTGATVYNIHFAYKYIAP